MNDVRHIVTVDFEKERAIDCTTGDQIVVVTFPSGLEPSLPTGVGTPLTHLEACPFLEHRSHSSPKELVASIQRRTAAFMPDTYLTCRRPHQGPYLMRHMLAFGCPDTYARRRPGLGVRAQETRSRASPASQ